MKCSICRRRLVTGVSGLAIHRKGWGRRCIMISQRLGVWARRVWTEMPREVYWGRFMH